MTKVTLIGLPLRGCVLMTALALSPSIASAQSGRSLLDLSLEELAEVQITSVSRRAEPLATSAAAVYVISADDIRRSGATTVPELLREVPGLHVARLGAHRWSISARGFGGEFSNKLLVLIDGRSVYTPVHSGVNWHGQDTLLEDIERIEVIRGPGATQWGANAVNGVINIITRPAADTQGGFARGTLGTRERGAAARWGGETQGGSHYRAYAKDFRHDEARRPDGSGAQDGWSQGRVGFRADGDATARESWTVQGEAYEGEVDRVFAVTGEGGGATPTYFENPTRGAHLLGRWTQARDDGSVSLQAYVDWYQAHPLLVRETVATYDLDFQHHLRVGAGHERVWGLGYRHIRDRFASSFTIDFRPSSDSTNVYSGFVQDTFELTERLALTLGSKLEYNEYTGFEPQPSVRLAWMPDRSQTVWGAISRAARTPSRAERDVIIHLPDSAGGGAELLRLDGNRNLNAERLIAYELGYRITPAPGLSFDTALFYHDYRDLVAREQAAGADPRTSSLRNLMDGESYGLEIATRWQASERLRFDLAYTYLQVRLNARPGAFFGAEAAEGNTPEHQISLRTRYDRTPRVRLDGALRYVDELPTRGVPSYTTLDMRLAWLASPRLTLSLVGQNLIGAPHAEFDPNVEFERAGYLRLDYRF